MADLLVLILVLGFFGVCVAFVFGCDRIIGPDDDADLDDTDLDDTDLDDTDLDDTDLDDTGLDDAAAEAEADGSALGVTA